MDILIASTLFCIVALALWFSITYANGIVEKVNIVLLGNNFVLLEELGKTGELINKERFDNILAGKDYLSVGVVLIIASTLIPTYLHFLVVLMSLLTMPLNQKKATKTQLQLKKARRTVINRIKTDSNQGAGAVQVHEYYRRWAILFFLASWPVIFTLWASLSLVISYWLFLWLTHLLKYLLAFQTLW